MTPRTRVRLALVVPHLASGGGVPAVARFLKNAAVRSGRFEVSLVSLSESADDPASLRLTSPQSWTHCPRVSTGEWEGRPFVHVGTVAGEFEFQRYRPRGVLTRSLAASDLIQVVSGSPAWANAVLGLGKPVALQVATLAKIERRRRDAAPRTPSALWRAAMTGITARLDDRALRAVDAIQVENPWMFDYARRLNDGRDVDLRFAPPGVDIEEFRPRGRREPELESYVLCVGRLGDPRKNIGLLLEAYALLPAAIAVRVRLVVAGATPPPAAFWRRAEALGVSDRISLVERPGEGALRRLYQEASVFALPSDEEGLGIVLLEAMSCGVPVVSTRSGGPDGIITDGEEGYLVPRDDAGALSSRLAQLLTDASLNVAMGRNARLTVERRYDERLVGEAFIGVWDRLAHKAGVA